MYRIGMFSKINKVTVKTLRYYDEVGLLKPAYVDQENGYRYYTSEQLPQLHKILALRQIGLSIEEISLALNDRNVVEIFEGRKAELEAKIEESKQQLKNITHYLKEIEEALSASVKDFISKEPMIKVFNSSVENEGSVDVIDRITDNEMQMRSFNHIARRNSNAL